VDAETTSHAGNRLPPSERLLCNAYLARIYGLWVFGATMRIELLGVSLSYGAISALRDLKVHLEGRVIGVLGANASGKTSLLSILSGVTQPTAGSALIDGEVVVHGKAVPGMAFLPQETKFFPFSQRPTKTLALSMSLTRPRIEELDLPQLILEALGLALVPSRSHVRGATDMDRGAAGGVRRGPGVQLRHPFDGRTVSRGVRHQPDRHC
jgi:energy-coupling factor transporter ATP-binding protein EcfA2